MANFWDIFTYSPESPMLFSSRDFLLLFLPFFAIYTLASRRVTWRNLYLTLFSIFFYYKTGGLYFLLLVLMSLTDYTLSLFVHTTENPNRRKWLVTTSVVIDLGILCYFKYTGMLGEMLSALTDGDISFGDIFLPVGISFFTFQSLSYVIDVYRREIAPAQSWSDYLFYLSFFPQLVAGPIVRAKDFLPQIHKPTLVTRQMMGHALFLILIGLIKKAIISDYISINYVDRIFDAPLLYSGFENLMGVYGYALQIYCDFSGYSDMAIGIALLLGFRFPKNFDLPYRSATITEFWRRWHISLSSWLRDYLYIPLGGNRKGRRRTYINLMLTMLLGGLWHGASGRFVLWGALHGVGLALHKWLMSRTKSPAFGKDMSLWQRVLGIIFTFNFVCLGWILFRADSLATVGQILSQIFNAFDLSIVPQVIAGYPIVFLLIAIGYLMHATPSRVITRTEERLSSAPFWVQVAVVVLVIWLVMQMRSGEIQPFIYFQF
ncbi:MAG: MBOAT family protein [Tidjanibacter sp.]|nr:MBOAT family protein [Tidjanibacter sp.]